MLGGGNLQGPTSGKAGIMSFSSSDWDPLELRQHTTSDVRNIVFIYTTNLSCDLEMHLGQVVENGFVTWAH